MIEEFSNAEDGKIKGHETTLKLGHEFYFNHIYIDHSSILKGFEDEILHWQKVLKSMLGPLSLILEAAKKMRVLPLFGCRSDKPDFYWPSNKDLVTFPL